MSKPTLSRQRITRRVGRKAARPGCEKMEGRVLLTQFTVTSTLDNESAGSLRWAIEQVNLGKGGDTIAFAIPGSGLRQININSALPALTSSATIDGTSQPGYAGVPLIAIVGPGAAGGTFDGLVLSAGNTTVEGLAIVGFGGDGIRIQAGANDLIAANYIGLLPGGTGPSPNGGDGIDVQGGSTVQVGGTQPGQGNVLSGNGGYGLQIKGAVGAGLVSGAIVEGNLIGTDPSGTRKLGNGLDGVSVANASSAVIGGTVLNAGNIISGNRGNGVTSSGMTDGLLVQGNFIGTDVTGVLNLGNGQNGVQLISSNNTIGGMANGSPNIIAFNGNPNFSQGAGVDMLGGVFNNAILSNSIYGNGGSGINLENSGNRNQAYPLLAAATIGTNSTNIVGSMTGTPGAIYTVQFFASDRGDPSGFGEGQRYLGSAPITLSKNGSGVINASVPGVVSPSQVISATVTDASGNTSAFARNLQMQSTPDLSVSMQALPAQASPGDQVTYRMTVTNQGQTTALGVLATDLLPSGISVVSALAQVGMISINSAILEVSIGALLPGAIDVITFVVQTSSASLPALANSVVVSSTNGDVDAGNNIASVVTPLTPISDLAVQVQGSSASVAEGQNVTYTITLTNQGPSTATNVALTDAIPAGTTLVSATVNRGTVSSSGGVVTALIDSVPSNAAPVILTVVVGTTAASLPSITDTASVASDNYDPNLANNSASATTAVTNLALVLSSSPNPVKVGDQLTYTVQLTNTGSTTATGLSLVDPLPQGVTFVSASDNQGGTSTYSGGVLTDSLASLAPGAVLIWTIIVTPTAAAPPSLVNTVTATETAPAGPSLSASTTTDVTAVADLSLAITQDRDSILAGQTVTYVLTVKNQGPSTATNVTLTDPIPANVTLQSATPSQGQSVVGPGGVLVNLGDMAAGASATVTLVFLTSAAAPGVTNTASVSSDAFDPNLTNNAANITTAVAQASHLTLSMQPPSGPVYVGETFQYMMTLANQGPYAATNVVLSDVLPAGVTFISAVDSLGNHPTLAPSGALSDPIASLANGASVTLTVTLSSTSAKSVTNSASVSSDLPDPDPTANKASASMSVVPAADLSVSLSADNAAVNTGQAVTYTATVTNHGPSAATGVHLSDVLPQGAVFVSAGAGVQSVSQAGGVVTLGLGTIASGGSVAITFTVMPNQVIKTSDTVTVAANEYDPVAGNNSASTALNVLESPGAIQFADLVYGVTDNAGSAVISVTRTGGARGAVSVIYCTPPGGTARPGIDFMPVAGTLTFQPGQTTATFSVPIINNPYNTHDQSIALRMFTPTGGASMGAQIASSVYIKVLNPDVIPPSVQDVRLAGPATGISDITLDFNKALDPQIASDPSHYQIVAVGADGRFGTGDDYVVGIQSVAYNSAANTVDIVPSGTLGANQFYYVRAIGLTDPGGLPLAGGEFDSYVGRGTVLVYPDSHNSMVTLRMTGGGVLDLTRFANGDANRLQILNPIYRRSTLVGRVVGGNTSLASVTGLGSFGEVKLKLSTPPFYVNQLPFNRTIMSPPSVDTVFASGGVRLPRRFLGRR